MAKPAKDAPKAATSLPGSGSVRGPRYSSRRVGSPSGDAIQVIPRFVPMSESEVEEVATIIARLFLENARRDMRGK
jgi:hypothetical protein